MTGTITEIKVISEKENLENKLIQILKEIAAVKRKLQDLLNEIKTA